MSLRRSRAIARNDLRLLARDPVPIVILTAMPLLLMAFIKPAYKYALEYLEGERYVNGAEQAVPGMVVMFSFFLVATTGFAFFREHGWNTWDRIRATRCSPTELLIGKAMVPLAVALCHLTALLILGGLLFDLRVRGSVAGIALLAVCLAVCQVAFALLLVVVCNTVLQFNVLANLGALLLAGLGGALTPIPILPGWARAVAPGAPPYWAMRGLREAILRPGGIGEILLPAAVLLGFAVGFGALAIARFSVEESKTGWA
jgi:ABC-2 type transport system permease protein